LRKSTVPPEVSVTRKSTTLTVTDSNNRRDSDASKKYITATGSAGDRQENTHPDCDDKVWDFQE
jgi:hypothetical protein